MHVFKPPRVSRREALERGQGFYFTGRPCRFKHLYYRLVSSRACRACELARYLAAQTDDPSSVLRLLLQGDRDKKPRDYLRIVGAKLPKDVGMMFFATLPFSSLLKLPGFIDGEPVKWGTFYGRVCCFSSRYEERLSNAELVRRATPKWAEKNLIQAFYNERDSRRAEDGMAWVVDHIIPLHHPMVCGLHVHSNLQVIPELENTRRRGIFVEETTVFVHSHSRWNNRSERTMQEG